MTAEHKEWLAKYATDSFSTAGATSSITSPAMVAYLLTKEPTSEPGEGWLSLPPKAFPTILHTRGETRRRKFLALTSNTARNDKLQTLYRSVTERVGGEWSVFCLPKKVTAALIQCKPIELIGPELEELVCHRGFHEGWQGKKWKRERNAANKSTCTVQVVDDLAEASDSVISAFIQLDKRWADQYVARNPNQFIYFRYYRDDNESQVAWIIKSAKQLRESGITISATGFTDSAGNWVSYQLFCRASLDSAYCMTRRYEFEANEPHFLVREMEAAFDSWKWLESINDGNHGDSPTLRKSKIRYCTTAIQTYMVSIKNEKHRKKR